MNDISHDRIIGIDVARDWFVVHFLLDGARLRWPNSEDGHARLAALAADRLRAAGKPRKVIVTDIARKLVTIANALCKSRQKWIVQPW